MFRVTGCGRDLEWLLSRWDVDGDWEKKWEKDLVSSIEDYVTEKMEENLATRILIQFVVEGTKSIRARVWKKKEKVLKNLSIDEEDLPMPIIRTILSFVFFPGAEPTHTPTD